jgi:hypothetical protein
VLKSLSLTVFSLACASGGGQIAFSPVLESVWHERCPETKIQVRETRRYAGRTVYVLKACGALFEVQQRVLIQPEPAMSPEEIARLRASLDQGSVPASIAAMAQALDAHPCQFETSARECVDSDVEVLGSDEDDGVRRWWIRTGERISVARFYWSQPLCGEHKYGPRPSCDL